ncbi:hypothetical protein EDD16DRAFT_1728203, partial [Pisolithus croceorrhizus]
HRRHRRSLQFCLIVLSKSRCPRFLRSTFHISFEFARFQVPHVRHVNCFTHTHYHQTTISYFICRAFALIYHPSVLCKALHLYNTFAVNA